MKCAWWAASIGMRLEGHAPYAETVIADSKIALEKIDFFPIVVNKRCFGKHTRFETEQSCSVSGLCCVIQ